MLPFNFHGCSNIYPIYLLLLLLLLKLDLPLVVEAVHIAMAVVRDLIQM